MNRERIKKITEKVLPCAKETDSPTSSIAKDMEMESENPKDQNRQGSSQLIKEFVDGHELLTIVRVTKGLTITSTLSIKAPAKQKRVEQHSSYGYSQLPKVGVLRFRSHVCESIQGPTSEDELFMSRLNNGMCCARSVSTYPRCNANLSKKLGDPICDAYSVFAEESGKIVVAVGDGCNWGEAAREAAQTATNAFVSHLARHSNKVTSVEEAGRVILRAFEQANSAIVYGKCRPLEAGSTTLLGGLLVITAPLSKTQTFKKLSANALFNLAQDQTLHVPQITRSSSHPEPYLQSKEIHWGFVGGSVGGSKALHFSTSKKIITDVTGDFASNGAGRLGPTIASFEDGAVEPDLSDLNLFYCPCQKNDLIILMTDGVYSNMEPLAMGYDPGDFLVNCSRWDSPEFAEKIREVRTNFFRSFLLNLINQAEEDLEKLEFTSPNLAERVLDKIIRHCFDITRKQREFIEQFPDRVIPNNYQDYPGKMDHTTCVVIQVGSVPEDVLERPNQLTLRKNYLHQSIEETDTRFTDVYSENTDGLESSSSSFKEILTEEPVKSVLYQKLPCIPVSDAFYRRMLQENKYILTLRGPKLRNPVEKSIDDLCSILSVSTYPRYPGCTDREGDPICDSYGLAFQECGMIIAVVADGCNWGKSPQLAAKLAKTEFMEYMRFHQHLIKDTTEAAHLLLCAMESAHKAITQDEDLESPCDGTTTILGGVVLELDWEPTSIASVSVPASVPQLLIPLSDIDTLEVEDESKSTDKQFDNDQETNDTDTKYAFVCCSIGDCKAFHFSRRTKRVTDVTAGNRINNNDPMDPGGRIGPYLPGGSPDLRNLQVYFCICEKDDIIILTSDGVADNLDPEELGHSPRDFNLDCDRWDDPKYALELGKCKVKFCQNFLQRKIICNPKEKNFTPHRIVNRLIDHCVQTTEASRQFMINNPTKRLPNDYKLYPGKMDHTTCVCFTVGKPIKSTLLSHNRDVLSRRQGLSRSCSRDSSSLKGRKELTKSMQ